jgi:hypothetical protein
MNTLDKLRAAQERRCVTVDVGDVPVTLAPLTAADGLALRSVFAGIDGLQADDPRLVEFYCELIARSAIEPDTGAKALDSDAGRALIRSLPAMEMMHIGAAAAQVNQFAREHGAAAKKNSLRKRS